LRVAYVPVGGDQGTGSKISGAFQELRIGSYEMSLQLVAILAPPTGGVVCVGMMRFYGT
jgi:hypothetical protein